jgi:macrolide transport system ATP-binding/permease protein
VIELKNVSRTYKSDGVGVQALKDVSIKINKGEFVAIMGASGSGKSTMLHILGLLDKVDSGSYYLDGKDVSNLTEDERALVRNNIAGFVFQQFQLLPKMSALQNAELPLIYAGKRHLKERALKCLQDVGLGERIHHEPNQLSGGEQQRVAIARALVNYPQIIFADEPTGNLDTKSEKEIMKIVGDLHRAGKTIVMVTHEMEVAEYAERIIIMRDGKVLSDEYKKDRIKKIETEIGNKNEEHLEQRPFTGISLLDHFRMAIYATLSHKMRSFLSMLGILIGVAAVIAMLALGRGAKESIEKNLASLGSNLLTVRPGSSRMHGVMMQSGTIINLTIQDGEILSKISGVKAASVSVSGRGQIVYGNKNWNTQVQGVTPFYETMRSAAPTFGRFFTLEEMHMRKRVALIGATVARELFGTQYPIGSIIKINRLYFQVIGLLPEKGSNGWQDQDDVIIIPVTTAMYRLLGKEYVDSIDVEVKDASFIDNVQDEIQTTIVKRHHIPKDKEDDAFQIRNMAEIQKTLETTSKTISMLLGSIAAISLLVGGIGIMNIMLVSVTERTREIGLRKAIGAKQQDIMMQFLIESVFLTVLGGIVGIAFGVGIAWGIAFFFQWATKVLMSSIILATSFSILIGLAFGLWPAKHASELNPIEALRYE